MGLSQLIAEEAGIEVLLFGSLELIAWGDVEEFLRAVARHGAAILGIEGFRIVDNQVVPDMDAIADFSDGVAKDNFENSSIQAARMFISQVKCEAPEMFFDFTLLSADSFPKHNTG